MQIQRIRRASRKAAFSLAELMVVIVILGLLATVVAPRLLDRLGDAKWGAARTDVAVISQTLTQFYIKNSRYPDSLEILVQPDENGKRYLDQRVVPTDPWGNEYGYEPPSGSEPDPRVICFGADGVPGGEGDDADRDNFMIQSNEWK